MSAEAFFTIPNTKKVYTREKDLGTGDIDGSRPCIKAMQYTNKPGYFTNEDIAGAKSKRLVPETVNRPQYNNTNDDIEGSKPKPYTFKTNRVNDPMNPQYKLPSAPMQEPVVPKFTRDSFDISDIEGTRTKKKFIPKNVESNKLDDIEGASAGWKPRHLRNRKQRDTMNCKDINVTGFKTNRVTDPNNPVHTVNGMRIEEDPLSKPRVLYKATNKKNDSLATSDIEGARPGWKPKHQAGGVTEENRRHYRNTNNTDDIAGARAGTRAHGLRSKRVSDPLSGAGVGLDGKPMDDPSRKTNFNIGVQNEITPAERLRAKDIEIQKLKSEIASLKGAQKSRSTPKYDANYLADVRAVRDLPK